MEPEVEVCMPLNISRISETFFFSSDFKLGVYATQPWLIIYAKVELEVTENGFSTFLYVLFEDTSCCQFSLQAMEFG